MIDLYTKIVLTVIAVALVGLVVEQTIPTATAQVGGSCGPNPCGVVLMTKHQYKGWITCDQAWDDKTPCLYVAAKTAQ